MVVFADRVDAGRHLARSLQHLAGEEVVVLGLPRGGVPVAAEVARALDAPLDVVVEGDSHGGFGAVRPPVQGWEEAGATWWVESWWDLPNTTEGRAELRRRIELGPPTR